MNYRFVRALLVVLLLVAAVAGVGSYMYHLGVANGIAASGRIAAPNGAPLVVFAPRPWGYGFGFFPFFPLLFFVLFWIFAARALFWRRRWYHGRCGYRSRHIPPPTTYL
jgi:hypothetical protein